MASPRAILCLLPKRTNCWVRKSSKHQERRAARGVWSLRLDVSLELGSWCLDLFSAHLVPSPRPSRLEHRIAHILRFQRVTEGRAGRLAVGHTLQKVRHLVDKAVLIADLQPRHPPLTHVRMVAVAHVDRAPAAHATFV